MSVGGETALDITREIMGNVPGDLQSAFYAGVAFACLATALALARRLISYWRAPRGVASAGRGMGRALIEVLRYLTLHEQLRRDRYAGIAHLAVVYGFGILFAGTCLVFLEDQTPLHFFYGGFYLAASLAMEVAGVALIVGLAMLIVRRHAPAGARLLNSWWVASMAWLLLGIAGTGFLLEGSRLAVALPEFERWSTIGYGLAVAMRSAGLDGATALALHRQLWAIHALLCIVFFALLPWRFFGHIAYGALSWATRKTAPLTQLRPSDLATSPGAAAGRELRWQDLLQADACTTCGRCNEVCPASAAGRPLQPRDVVLGLRAAGPDDELIPHFVRTEALWSCTTCAACNEVCPTGIAVVDKIVELRRGLVEQGRVPGAAVAVFDEISARRNPFGTAPGDRLAWAAGLDVPLLEEGGQAELLYWIGCAGSCDPQGQAVSRAMIQILNRLGLDYGVLGQREPCSGDPARRLGEEGQFQSQAKAVIELLQSHGVRKVLTHCAHCFNVFANEYPPLGSRLQVEHHSQFLARMMAAGRLAPVARSQERMTFHDPCYLGRGNGETQAPRAVIAALSSTALAEMPRRGCASFCCGAGGGSMWLDPPGDERIENLRAREAAQTGASTVVTACPFCKTMLHAAMAPAISGGAAPAVKDLAELVVESAMAPVS